MALHLFRFPTEVHPEDRPDPEMPEGEKRNRLDKVRGFVERRPLPSNQEAICLLVGKVRESSRLVAATRNTENSRHNCHFVLNDH